MTRASREKGKRGERQLATRLREAFPEFADSVRRGWQTRLGNDAPDVIGLPGFWLESKCGLRPNPRSAYTQAKTDAGGRGIPVGVIQDDGARDRLAILSLTDLLAILRAAYGFDAPLKRDG